MPSRCAPRGQPSGRKADLTLPATIAFGSIVGAIAGTGRHRETRERRLHAARHRLSVAHDNEEARSDRRIEVRSGWRPRDQRAVMVALATAGAGSGCTRSRPRRWLECPTAFRTSGIGVPQRIPNVLETSPAPRCRSFQGKPGLEVHDAARRRSNHDHSTRSRTEPKRPGHSRTAGNADSTVDPFNARPRSPAPHDGYTYYALPSRSSRLGPAALRASTLRSRRDSSTAVPSWSGFPRRSAVGRYPPTNALLGQGCGIFR